MTEPSSDLWTRDVAAPDGAGRHGTATRTAPGAGLTGASRAPGRVPPVRTRQRRRRWPLFALALVGVGALLLGLVRCSVDSGGTVVPEPPRSVLTPPPPPAAAGSLTASGGSVFAAAAATGTDLAALAGQTARGHAVLVQSVPADEGFWIGTSRVDRVWVQLTGNGESAITITAGQALDLAGPVVPHGPDFAGKAGLSVADGAEQLTRQGAHLEVDPTRITVVAPG